MTKRCLITYEILKKNEHLYSEAGLKRLNARLTELKTFPYTTSQLLNESRRLASKISIQGVQPKLSVQLSVKDSSFVVVEKNGLFIMKPETPQLPELPENEDLTMHLGAIAGFDVPFHSLIACEDESRAYVIKRFDRTARSEKIAQEDFAQLMQASRSTKYQATMEHISDMIEKFCTFPRVESIELLRRMFFTFVTGNEDMHLKKFSVLTNEKNIIKLTPLYDMLNSTIALADPIEEFALSMNQKKSNLSLEDFIKFGVEELTLSEKLIRKEIAKLCAYEDQWLRMIEISFLSDEQKSEYVNVLVERLGRF